MIAQIKLLQLFCGLNENIPLVSPFEQKKPTLLNEL